MKVKELLLNVNRTGYETSQCKTITVGELIGMLEDYDEDTPIYFSNDNGYTYGGLWYDTVEEVVKDEEDEEEVEEEW